MGNTICAICGRPTEDILLTVDGQENICMDCATKMAARRRSKNGKLKSPTRAATPGTSAPGARTFSPKATFGRRPTSVTSATGASRRFTRGAKASPSNTETQSGPGSPGSGKPKKGTEKCAIHFFPRPAATVAGLR